MSIRSATRTIALRIRLDYGLRDRRAEYVELLHAALEAGYELISLAEFHARVPAGGNSAGVNSNRRLLVLRHDVDIRDVTGNEAFFAVERAVGARSTFYFRRSTAGVHARMIPLLLDEGFEVGYHFEEAAALAKRDGLRSRTDVLRRRQEIEESFRRNCSAFRHRWNPHLESVAAHGDWINRRLAFTNHEFVSRALLAECGLRFEAYGDDIMGGADVYLSDVARSPLRWAAGYGLADALRDARGPIYLLTHERRWHNAGTVKLAADFDRLADEFRYRLRA
jgi:hypothetical protein